MSKALFVVVSCVTAVAWAAEQPAAGQQRAGTKPSIVLIHGAFADGSSWADVIPALQAEGYNVIAVQNPLTSLADDVAAAKRAIEEQPGKVVLVGHSWGGSVITQAGDNDKVAALVYVAAFAPDIGESSVDTGKGFPQPPGLANPVVSGGFMRLSPEATAKHFAQDLPAAKTKVMAATQGPVATKCFDEKLTVAAWKTKPSFYIVAENDHMIAPEAERSMAKRMNATTTTLPTSHVAMLAKPKEVAAVILSAAKKAASPERGAAREH
jgi:pimeloyl-ACP methyl ester carboxylesterase